MGSRIVDAIVAVAVLLSGAALVVLFARPFLWPPAPVALPSAAPASSMDDGSTDGPLIGLYQLRGRLSFNGVCLGLELDDDAAPTDEGAGSARVLWWLPTAIDFGNPAACGSRAGELNAVTAGVEPAVDEAQGGEEVVGYSVRFALPAVDASPAARFELLILLNRSTPDALQVLVLSPQGSPGLVFDRVAAIDPPFEPRPSATPTVLIPPVGIFLLRGTLEADGPCLVVELDSAAYPVDADAVGTARVRSWMPGGNDPDDPARCLTRLGEIDESDAVVTATGDPLAPGGVSFTLTFALPLPGADGRTVGLEFLADQPPDLLHATLTASDSSVALVFDRVDAIDPPLAP